jgi:tetratricopeptide (TPR) repeat protein
MHIEDANLRNKLFTAEMMELAGQYKHAEKIVLEVISCIEEDKQEIIGALHINLGQIAERDNRLDEAIHYYKKAIDHLSVRKGEAILQNAHGHFNVARIHLYRNNPEAVYFSRKALELFSKYPFSSAADWANAKMAYVVSKAQIESPVTLEECKDVWREIRQLPFKDINAPIAYKFSYVFIAHLLLKESNELTTLHFLKELSDWAGEDFVTDLVDTVETRAAKFKKHR